MPFLRKAALVVATALLPLFLFGFGLMFSLLQVYGSPDHIKAALVKSGVYNTFISDVLSEVKVADGGEETIPVDQPEVKNIIQNAASAEFLQQQTADFLDGMYSWVKGDSNELSLEINIIDAKAKLIDGIAAYANERLTALPPCTGPVPVDSFDPLNAECIPPGTDQAAAVERLKQEIANADFLKDPVITADDIKADNGKTLEEQLKAVPGVYNQIVSGVWATGLMALFMAAAIVALRAPWRAGLKRVGIVFIVVGAVSVGLALGASLATGVLADALAQSGDNKIQASLTEIVHILTNDLRVWWMGYGLILALIGVATLLILKFTKKDQAAETPLDETPAPKDKKPAKRQTPAKPAAKPSKTT
jgi:hypothetical protein